MHVYGPQKQPQLYSKEYFGLYHSKMELGRINEHNPGIYDDNRFTTVRIKRPPRVEVFANSPQVQAVINDFMDASQRIMDRWARTNGNSANVFLTE